MEQIRMPGSDMPSYGLSDRVKGAFKGGICMLSAGLFALSCYAASSRIDAYGMVADALAVDKAVHSGYLLSQASSSQIPSSQTLLYDPKKGREDQKSIPGRQGPDGLEYGLSHDGKETIETTSSKKMTEISAEATGARSRVVDRYSPESQQLSDPGKGVSGDKTAEHGPLASVTISVQPAHDAASEEGTGKYRLSSEYLGSVPYPYMDPVPSASTEQYDHYGLDSIISGTWLGRLFCLGKDDSVYGGSHGRDPSVKSFIFGQNTKDAPGSSVAIRNPIYYAPSYTDDFGFIFKDGSHIGKKFVNCGTEHETAVYHVMGKSPGPTVLIYAPHADERSAVEAALELSGSAPKAGNLIIFPIPDMVAYKKNIRSSAKDRNRLYDIGMEKQSDESEELVRQMIWSRSVSGILNLHEGNGLHKKDKNSYGYTIVYDSPVYTDKGYEDVRKKRDIPDLDRIISEINRDVHDPMHQFSLYRKPMPSTLTYFGELNGIFSVGVEVSRQGGSLEERTGEMLNAVCALLSGLGVEMGRIYEEKVSD